ncbi:MAG: zinc metallopeptidase [Caldilineaceae bacterium SB0665_bin_21]|nr:zinc metallopeptidase [Caldilineaceae bacterium SB0665_bin_21]MYA03697.1 zinc metallopeptidase [Caldilineaceae bacterium SB0664_bin_22]MYC62767.1 zinc metallopeptidase [Caldilineaceae bacterium SB0661_bin_34]
MGIYFLLIIPSLLLGLWAQARVKRNMGKYSKVANIRGLTGAQTARQILDSQGLYDVPVEESTGWLSDHYHPGQRALRLSRDVFHGCSVAAAGIAAHEAGHAVQHQQGYAPLRLRSAAVPTANLGGWLGPGICFLGAIMQTPELLGVGVVLFALTTVFTLITLPVEFNASTRARQLLVGHGILYAEEMEGVNKVLNAAALTYVAAAVSSVMTLAYYAFLLVGLSRD